MNMNPTSRWMIGLFMSLAPVMTIAQQSLSLPAEPSHSCARTVHVSSDPAKEVPDIFVASGVSTVIRLPSNVDRRRTRFNSKGWRARFEPVGVIGRSVVIFPLRDLAPGERFPLLVRLRNGKTISFSVTSGGRVDGHVDAVLPLQAETPEALKQALKETQERVTDLVKENSRLRREELSADHALAALLASGDVALTPFKQQSSRTVMERGPRFWLTTFKARESRLAVNKLAVVVTVTNRDKIRFWDLNEAKLWSRRSWREKPLAFRATPASIAPGMNGRIAMVTDESAFESEDTLVFEIARAGRVEAGVELTLADFKDGTAAQPR